MVPHDFRAKHLVLAAAASIHITGSHGSQLSQVAAPYVVEAYERVVVVVGELTDTAVDAIKRVGGEHAHFGYDDALDIAERHYERVYVAVAQTSVVVTSELEGRVDGPSPTVTAALPVLAQNT